MNFSYEEPLPNFALFFTKKLRNVKQNGTATIRAWIFVYIVGKIVISSNPKIIITKLTTPIVIPFTILLQGDNGWLDQYYDDEILLFDTLLVNLFICFFTCCDDDDNK